MHLELQLFGRKLEFSTKALPPLRGLSSDGWWPVVREAFTGAWQRDITVSASTALSYYAVFACHTLIASDIGKLCLRLVQEEEEDVWTKTENPAFSPVI